jgi:hypothetical protein
LSGAAGGAGSGGPLGDELLDTVRLLSHPHLDLGRVEAAVAAGEAVKRAPLADPVADRGQRDAV